MNYSQRITLTITLSLLAHVALIAAWPGTRPIPVESPEPTAITVRLREAPLRYIDAHTPSDTPPEAADLIAVHDARAASMEDSEDVMAETPPGPPPDIPDVTDAAAHPTAIPQEPLLVRPEPLPAPAAAPEIPAPESPTEKEPEQSMRDDITERTIIARAMPLPAPPTQQAPDASRHDFMPPESATAGQPMPPQDLRARPRRRTVTHGVTNFEALRHEIAPYLKHIRDKVEQRWMEALLMRYTGTSPTRAEVFCAIAPDGTLAAACIVGTTDDPIFAGICRDAVERAAPFEPFPFETPDIYRNENLEINWHFSFL